MLARVAARWVASRADRGPWGLSDQLMQTTMRMARLALVALLVLALQPPAGAESTSRARQRQAEARARRARIAARIDTLRASDRQLADAVRALDSNIVAQQAGTDAARQAAAAADLALATAKARLEATERELAQRRQAVVDRAVAAYVEPGGGMMADLVSARNISEATRKRALFENVIADDRSIVERLRAVEEDLVVQREVLTTAQQSAAARRRQAEARLVALRRARSEQARVRSALDLRIKEYLAEADAVAREEATLSRYIRENETVVAGPVGAISGAGLIWPVRGRVTSPFGYRWGRLHAGIDIGAGTGTPIKAAKAGQVIGVGCGSGYGNCVIIAHGGGLTTLYAHQSRVAVGRGQSVGQGQVIGYVGSTGHSTGPHLHFETRVNGSPQNPRRFLS